jgi:hypothetical protein
MLILDVLLLEWFLLNILQHLQHHHQHQKEHLNLLQQEQHTLLVKKSS